MTPSGNIKDRIASNIANLDQHDVLTDNDNEQEQNNVQPKPRINKKKIYQQESEDEDEEQDEREDDNDRRSHRSRERVPASKRLRSVKQSHKAKSRRVGKKRARRSTSQETTSSNHQLYSDQSVWFSDDENFRSNKTTRKLSPTRFGNTSYRVVTHLASQNPKNKCTMIKLPSNSTTEKVKC